MRIPEPKIRQIIREELQSLVERERPKRFLGMSGEWLLKKGWAWSPEENDFFKGKYRLSKTVARWKERKARKTQIGSMHGPSSPAPAAVKGAGLAAIKPTKGDSGPPEVTKGSHDWNTEECPYSWWDPRAALDMDCPPSDWGGSVQQGIKGHRKIRDLTGGGGSDVAKLLYQYFKD